MKLCFFSGSFKIEIFFFENEEEKNLLFAITQAICKLWYKWIFIVILIREIKHLIQPRNDYFNVFFELNSNLFVCKVNEYVWNILFFDNYLDLEIFYIVNLIVVWNGINFIHLLKDEYLEELDLFMNELILFCLLLLKFLKFGSVQTSVK